MATAALTPGPKFRYGSYESVEVVETSGSLSRVITPGGDAFWVKTAKLKEIRVPGTKSKARRTLIARAWSPEFELFFARLGEIEVYMGFNGSAEYLPIFFGEYESITGEVVSDETLGVTVKIAATGTTYSISFSSVVIPAVPGGVHVTHLEQRHGRLYSEQISSKEMFFELLRRGFRLGVNHAKG